MDHTANYYLDGDGNRILCVDLITREWLELQHGIRSIIGGYDDGASVSTVHFSVDRLLKADEEAFLERIIRKITFDFYTLIGIPEADKPFPHSRLFWYYENRFRPMDPEPEVQEEPFDLRKAFQKTYPRSIVVRILEEPPELQGGVHIDIGGFHGGRFLRWE